MSFSNAQVTQSHAWLNIPNDIMGRYNAFDCLATARAYKTLTREMTKNGQQAYWEKSYWPWVPSIMAIQSRGLRVNVSAKTLYRRRIRAELREIDSYLEDVSGVLGFNARSPIQIGKFLYDDLGLKPTKRTAKTGKPSRDQDALYRLWRQESSRWLKLKGKDNKHGTKVLETVRVLETLIHYSKLNTIDTRYLDKKHLKLDDNDRVYPTIKPHGAETGRVAYSKPALQQWTQEIRHIIIPRMGYVFVARDYLQLEARILAYLSEDLVSIRTFEAGGDIHIQNAVDLFGLTENQWSGLDKLERKARRDFAKTFLYRISYGGSIKSNTATSKVKCPCPKCEDELNETHQGFSLNLTKAQIGAAEDRWFAKHPKVKEFQRQLVDRVYKTGYLRNAWGRLRKFSTPGARSEILNNPMQSSGAEIINAKMVKLHKLGAPMVLQMHDELVLEVPSGQSTQWNNTLKRVMEEPVPELNGISFPTDGAIGRTWAELK